MSQKLRTRCVDVTTAIQLLAASIEISVAVYKFAKYIAEKLTSDKKLQRKIVQLFSEINTATFNLEEIADLSIPECTVIFEFGIAEADHFNYLDHEETNKVLKVIQNKPFQVMDFFCAIRYYKVQEGKKTPLRFDYYIIHFIFDKDSMEMQVFHEMGPTCVSPYDMADFVADKTKGKFSKILLSF